MGCEDTKVGTRVCGGIDCGGGSLRDGEEQSRREGRLPPYETGRALWTCSPAARTPPPAPCRPVFLGKRMPDPAPCITEKLSGPHAQVLPSTGQMAKAARKASELGSGWLNCGHQCSRVRPAPWASGSFAGQAQQLWSSRLPHPCTLDRQALTTAAAPQRHVTASSTRSSSRRGSGKPARYRTRPCLLNGARSSASPREDGVAKRSFQLN